jgi:hypothetical protein
MTLMVDRELGRGLGRYQATTGGEKGRGEGWQGLDMGEHLKYLGRSMSAPRFSGREKERSIEAELAETTSVMEDLAWQAARIRGWRERWAWGLRETKMYSMIGVVDRCRDPS